MEEGWQTLRCQASGNPIPKVDCHRKGDGALLPIGELRLFTRDISGTYVCQATSHRGVDTREVVVNVICECQCWGRGWVGEGAVSASVGDGAGSVSLAQPPSPLIVLPTDQQSNLVTIIVVVALLLGIAATAGTAAYLYNRQRKIRKYKLQKAQEAAAMKLNTPP